MHTAAFQAQLQPQREGPLGVHLEAGAVPAVGAADLLGVRGVGENLSRRDRIRVLLPPGV